MEMEEVDFVAQDFQSRDKMQHASPESRHSHVRLQSNRIHEVGPGNVIPSTRCLVKRAQGTIYFEGSFSIPITTSTIKIYRLQLHTTTTIYRSNI